MMIELLEKFKNITFASGKLDVIIREAVPGDHSEVFMFMGRRFEIGDAWKMIEHDKSRFQITQINLEGVKGMMHLIGVNKEHAKSIPVERMNQPGIVIRLPGGVYMLIDGWHRAHNLIKKGVDTMPAYVITDIEDIEVVSEETAEAIREEDE